VNQKIKIRDPDGYSNCKVKKPEPVKGADPPTPAQKELLDLKYDIDKKTTLMKVRSFSHFKRFFDWAFF